jgi:hypothetical protein
MLVATPTGCRRGALPGAIQWITPASGIESVA